MGVCGGERRWKGRRGCPGYPSGSSSFVCFIFMGFGASVVAARFSSRCTQKRITSVRTFALSAATPAVQVSRETIAPPHLFPSSSSFCPSKVSGACVVWCLEWLGVSGSLMVSRCPGLFAVDSEKTCVLARTQRMPYSPELWLGTSTAHGIDCVL